MNEHRANRSDVDAGNLKTYRSGWHFGRLVLCISILVSVAICVFDGQPKARGAKLLQELIPSLIVFNLMCLALGISMAHQRVRLDADRRSIDYLNLGTLYRWRSIEIASIEKLELVRASGQMNVLVDVLVIHRIQRRSQGTAIVRLMDERLSPVWNQTNSALFASVHDFVKRHNPKANLSRALYPAD